MEKESALRFMSLLGQKEKIADFLVNQQLAITGLTKNNEAFAEAFRAQKNGELAATTANSVSDAIVAHIDEFCNICDLTEIQRITMRNFSSWVQQQHP